MNKTIPLAQRKADWFFVVIFSTFAFTSFFSDAWHALDLLSEDMFWAKANRWYADVALDYYFAAEHKYLRISTGISGFIYGPFYCLLVYCFITGKNWIRLWALLYVGAMIHGTGEYLAWQYFVGPAPGNPFIFWAFNGPYIVIPVLLAIRLWRPEPFSQSAE